MLDDAPQSIPPATVSDPTATPATPPEAPKQAPIPFNIGEEFGTASKNLPPLKIILIAVAAVAIIGAVISFVQKPRQKATGAIENVVSAEVPNQNLLMVGVEISIHNQGDKLFLPAKSRPILKLTAAVLPTRPLPRWTSLAMSRLSLRWQETASAPCSSRKRCNPAARPRG
jgi:hypothetical protein